MAISAHLPTWRSSLFAKKAGKLKFFKFFKEVTPPILAAKNAKSVFCDLRFSKGFYITHTLNYPFNRLYFFVFLLNFPEKKFTLRTLTALSYSLRAVVLNTRRVESYVLTVWRRTQRKLSYSLRVRKSKNFFMKKSLDFLPAAYSIGKFLKI